MKEKKQIQRKQRKNGQSKTIKLKNTRSTNVFLLSTNLIERLDKLKKGSEKTQKTVKKCEKTTKTKLILSRKYLNCHLSSEQKLVDISSAKHEKYIP